ncbi:succinate dehydrogenase/fumarate reductase iron-sulfur subunit [candidate division KSB1 bacterium]
MAENNSKDRFGSQVTFKVLRFDPDRDKKPYFKSYNLTLERGMTVLDALIHLKETQDPTLSYRMSCRMGICGSCAMFVNGLPVLSCQTQVNDLDSDLIVVKPLPNYPIIRDLVPDLDSMLAKHSDLLPYIIRPDTQEMNQPTGEFAQTPEELNRYVQFTYCIKCGSCLSACPTCATDKKFSGPQALTQAYRYIVDSRDAGFERRSDAACGPHGLWRCHLAGACSEACPKGVDPALGAQLLKREVVARQTGLKAPAAPATLAVQPESVERRPDIPEPPPPTVGPGE